MPPHSSHLLQSLNVTCFSPLKRAYGDKILALAHNHITHIAKEDFLPAFKAAYNKAFIENNIYTGFRGAKLVLLKLDIIILKLNI